MEENQLRRRRRFVSLETMLRGVCQPERLLDMVENFTLFEEAPGRAAQD